MSYRFKLVYGNLRWDVSAIRQKLANASEVWIECLEMSIIIRELTSKASAQPDVSNISKFMNEELRSKYTLLVIEIHKATSLAHSFFSGNV